MIENPGDAILNRDPPQKRYYVWLDDFQDCRRITYEVGDRLYEKYRDPEFSFSVKSFEADQEDEAYQWVADMNLWWEQASKDELGMDFYDMSQLHDNAANHRDRLDGLLSEAVGLIVRLHHDRITENIDREIDQDLESFWNHWTKAAVPNNLLNMAYQDGLPVYHELRNWEML